MLNHDKDPNLANRAPASSQGLSAVKPTRRLSHWSHLKNPLHTSHSHCIYSSTHCSRFPVKIVYFLSSVRATFLAQPFIYIAKLIVMQLVRKSTSLIHQTRTSLSIVFPYTITCCLPQLHCVAFRGSSVFFSYFLLFTDVNEFHGIRSKSVSTTDTFTVKQARKSSTDLQPTTSIKNNRC